MHEENIPAITGHLHDPDRYTLHIGALLHEAADAIDGVSRRAERREPRVLRAQALFRLSRAQ